MTTPAQALDSLLAAADPPDTERLRAAVGGLVRAVSAEPGAIATLIPRINAALGTLPAPGAAWLAIGCGALTERGVDLTAIGTALVQRFRSVLSDAARFAAAWTAAGEAPLPASGNTADDPSEAVRAGLGADAQECAAAWVSLRMFVSSMLTTLAASAATRRAIGDGEALRADIDALRAIVEQHGDPQDAAVLIFIADLLRVVDDELIVVLHAAVRRGFVVRVSGVGDNRQLTTLLAGALIGSSDDGLFPGTPPDPAWVHTATDGPAGAESAHARFDLVDAYGHDIPTDATPAAIPLLDGTRVVVVRRPATERTWRSGRRFPLMKGSLVIDRALAQDEVDAWLARLAEAATPPR